jgi:hypothetical protein
MFITRRIKIKLPGGLRCALQFLRMIALLMMGLWMGSVTTIGSTVVAKCHWCHGMQLYAADGIAEAVDFEMHSAIRSAGNVTKDHAWDCPDEDSGCPMSKFAHPPHVPRLTRTLK